MSGKSKRDLKSWWKDFSRAQKRKEEEKADENPLRIFGVPLQVSERYANVAISLQDADGKSYIYGYLPIIVAKCGVFLKEKATDVEGIFRVSGDSNRVKELRAIFDSPDRYGKGLNWTGYTVHDAAEILKMYLNQLPEPVVPPAFYERFRDPIKYHQSQAVGQLAGQRPSVGSFDYDYTLGIFQSLIFELPPLNRQLLLYLLDLLAVFASKSDENKMSASSLAAIFQPSILFHVYPEWNLSESRLSQDVLMFLIINQEHILNGVKNMATPATGTVKRSSTGESWTGSDNSKSSNTPETTQQLPSEQSIPGPSSAAYIKSAEDVVTVIPQSQNMAASDMEAVKRSNSGASRRSIPSWAGSGKSKPSNALETSQELPSEQPIPGPSSAAFSIFAEDVTPIVVQSEPPVTGGNYLPEDEEETPALAPPSIPTSPSPVISSLPLPSISPLASPSPQIEETPSLSHEPVQPVSTSSDVEKAAPPGDVMSDPEHISGHEATPAVTSSTSKTVTQQDIMPGRNIDKTPEKRDVPQEVPTMPASPSSTNSVSETVLSRLSDFFSGGNETRVQYTDLQISQISFLLSHLNPHWSRVPRTYIILRLIGCLSQLDTFIDLGFSDYWFPVTEKSLPFALRPSDRSKFVAAQDLVITKSIDLEKGENGRHCHFRRDEPLPFEEKGILGAGGFGQVDKVLSLISFREYARKRVPRNKIFSGRRTEDVKRFVIEIQILKRLKHHHVVEFIGSYTDSKFMGLIMSPVAEMDLSAYLNQSTVAKHAELRTFFGCLARSLEFLHEQNVRHKDIKPANILIHHGNILLTDFGLSFDFTDETGSTTVSMVNGMTPRYCAPEVAMQEPRNTSSDIWSLGVVFIEMVAVLKHRTVEYVYNFLKEHGTKQANIRTNYDGYRELIADLKQAGDQSDNKVLVWVQDMLFPQPQLRPTAASLIASITVASKDGEGKTFCGICCVSPDDDVSDELDELDDFSRY